MTSLDTARGYGEAEERIGRFLAGPGRPVERPYITTKIPVNTGELEKSVFETAGMSLSALGLSKVNCILLHSPVEMASGGKALAKVMGKLVTAGYADEVGVSVYLPAEADAMLQYEEYTAIQIPVSLFDQRMINSGAIRRLKERNILIFARSVFMQGVLFLDPDGMDEPLLIEHAAPHIRTLRRIAGEAGVGATQLAISFARDIEGVASIVLGSETVDQVRENIRLMEGPPIGDRAMAAVREAFRDVNCEGIMTVLRRPKG